MEHDIKIEKQVHPLWSKVKELNFSSLIGKYQYVYSSPKGRISLIELPRDDQPLFCGWEIYCLEGDLVEDVERFDTKNEAEARIRSLLTI